MGTTTLRLQSRHTLCCRLLGLACAGSLSVSLLAGCGVGSIASPPDVQVATLSGRVHGGNQPVQGAFIALYATTSSGYGGTVTPIATTTTDANGDFSFATAPTCPASQFAYVIATGGNPGLAAGTNNTAIMLMAALGPCSSLGASVFADVNEVTSIAAAYALSGFLPAGGAGLTYSAISGGGAVPGVTTSSTNLQGLTDAFANAANIVSTATGTAYTTTPTGGTVPQATIYALADILQDCVNSASATSTRCTGATGSLTQAKPPAATGIATPVNSLQAAIDIAQYPGNNVAGLYGLISANPAFATTITTAPNDWTIGVTYTSPLMVSPLGLAIDNSDNVYVSGSYQKTPLIDADLIEFTPQGGGGATDLVTLSAATQNVRYMAIDLSGNIFLADGAATGVYKYVPGQTVPEATTFLDYSQAPASNSDANNYAVAVDKLGDVWTTSYKKSTCATGSKICDLVEFVKGAAYAPNSTFGASTTVLSPGVGGARGLAFDVNTGNVWITDIAENDVTLFPTTPNATTAATPGTPVNFSLGTEAAAPATNQYGAVAVAIDKSGNAWVVVTGGPVNGSQPAIPAGLYPISSTGVAGTPVLGGGLTTPAYLAIDGNNNIFVANGTSSTLSAIVEYDPSIASGGTAPVGFLSPNAGFSPGATYTSSTNTLSGGPVYSASYVAVDRSGALWVLSGGTGISPSLANLVQILGVAAPTNPVLTAGQYGVKP